MLNHKMHNSGKFRLSILIHEGTDMQIEEKVSPSVVRNETQHIRFMHRVFTIWHSLMISTMVFTKLENLKRSLESWRPQGHVGSIFKANMLKCLFIVSKSVGPSLLPIKYDDEIRLNI